MNGPIVMPLMPWDNVLFPGMLLPLHVSGQQDLLLVRHCLDSRGEFGLLLDAGDPIYPHSVGTVAKIIDYQPREDDEMTLLITGSERFCVVEMIDDDPYTRAMVEPFSFVYDVSRQELDERGAQARRLFNRCVRLIASQRGSEQGVLTLPEKTTDLGWAIAASLVIPPPERQKLLEKESPAGLLQSEILYLESLLAELREQ